MGVHDRGQVGDDHRDPVDRGGPGHLRVVPQLGRDPLAGQPEDRLHDGGAGQRVQVVAQGQDLAARGRAAPGLHPGDPDHVGGRRQVHRVAGAHRGQHQAQLHGHAAAQGADAGQQVVASPVDDVHQVRGQLDLQGVHPHLFDQVLGGFLLRHGGLVLRLHRGQRCVLGLLRLDALRGKDQQAADQHERQLGHARHQGQGDRGGAGDQQRGARLRQLGRGRGAHVVGRVGAGDDHAGGHGHEQRGDLRGQSVADGQQRVGVQRLARCPCRAAPCRSRCRRPG